ncbi:MAG: hypothetical protein B7X61_05920 [Gallionellales bacterium 39-52-133]|nr:MAG: hypothetical protein B7X61_05920 [Gallionellales bacterium 39-52-133]
MTNSTNEIHALLDRLSNKVIAVQIIKGSFSPVSVKIGDNFAKLKAAFPTGKIARYDSELIDPVSYRVNTSGKKLAFTVEWEPTFFAQGGKWETFDAEKVPVHAKIIGILWE